MNSPGPYLSSHLPLSLPKSLGLQIWEHTGRSTTRNFPLNSSPDSLLRESVHRPPTHRSLQESLPATFRSREATRLLG